MTQQRPHLGPSMTLAAEHHPANAFLSTEAVLLGPVLRSHRGTSLTRKRNPPRTPIGPCSAPTQDPP